jgi:hypothetical protein
MVPFSAGIFLMQAGHHPSEPMGCGGSKSAGSKEKGDPKNEGTNGTLNSKSSQPSPLVKTSSQVLRRLNTSLNLQDILRVRLVIYAANLVLVFSNCYI